MPTVYTPAPPEVVALLEEVLASFERFRPLVDCGLRIELRMASKPDGTPALKHHGGRAAAVVKVVSPEERSRALTRGNGEPADVRIKICAVAWEQGITDRRARAALLCHELYHLELKTEAGGKPKLDPYGRPVVNLIHDDYVINGFYEVAAWFGSDSVERTSIEIVGARLADSSQLSFMEAPAFDEPAAEVGASAARDLSAAADREAADLVARHHAGFDPCVPFKRAPDAPVPDAEDRRPIRGKQNAAIAKAVEDAEARKADELRPPPKPRKPRGSKPTHAPVDFTAPAPPVDERAAKVAELRATPVADLGLPVPIVARLQSAAMMTLGTLHDCIGRPRGNSLGFSGEEWKAVSEALNTIDPDSLMEEAAPGLDDAAAGTGVTAVSPKLAAGLDRGAELNDAEAKAKRQPKRLHGAARKPKPAPEPGEDIASFSVTVARSGKGLPIYRVEAPSKLAAIQWAKSQHADGTPVRVDLDDRKASPLVLVARIDARGAELARYRPTPGPQPKAERADAAKVKPRAPKHA